MTAPPPRPRRYGRHEVGRPVAPARHPLGDQPAERGHHRLGQRPVGDVLAGERRLVHVGAQVAGIDPPDPDGDLLGRQHVAGLLERGLGRSVAAPAGVRLDRGVGGDAEHGAAALAQRRQQQLGQGERGDHVDLEGGAQLVEREVGDRGQRAGAQCPGVVDQQVRAAQGVGRAAQVGAVGWVGDIAGKRGDDGASRAGRPWPVQRRPVPRVDDEPVPVVGQGTGQRAAQPAGRTGDNGHPARTGACGATSLTRLCWSVMPATLGGPVTPGIGPA